ncbi:MAG: AAA family ATPase [Clostridia bacterium]|jgi:exonuclease SbcC|nr:AAA family ATPase [Clostridia bacterium]
MEIKIFSLKLKNFKGIKELKIDFNCQNTNIYGANATGKTTVFDAFKWLFFDKDSNDRKDFNIKTLDNNNNPIHFLEHEVEAILIIDGVDMTFKKVLQEKWVKKRGESDQEFSGHETNYWIDEVPVKKKDYEEKINSLIPESLFKLITDPTYFNNQLKWTERRELLINISGTNISDNEILDSKEEFKILKDNLEGRSIDDYKKVVQAKIKDLNKEKETIPVRIDELTNTLITEHDINYKKVEDEKEEYNKQINGIELEMTDTQTKAKENMKIADQLAIAKKELADFKLKKETEYSQKYATDLINLQNEKKVIENTIRLKQEEDSDRLLKIKSDQKRKEELYKKWDEVSKTTLEFAPNSFICPTCKREYETDKKEEIKKQFEDNLNLHKRSEQEAINREGQAINIRLDENTKAREKIQQELPKLDNKLEEINTKIAKIEKTKETDNSFDVTSLPEYSNKIKEIEELEEKVKNLTNGDISYLQNKKAEIIEAINKLNKTLNERDTQEKTKQRIEELQTLEEDISNKIQELEGQQYALEEFTKTKVELLENAINSKFELVKFRLFDTQINGGLIECCDTLVNGVPYADVNNAHKILAGLDIINTLIKFYNTSAPIFIDNRESINEIYNINTQIINLIVTTDSTLRIEVM